MEEQNLASSIMSDIITHMKYARYLPVEHRREAYVEIIDRNKAMHIKKFPHLKDEIEEAYKLVYEKKILPSMRSLQFSGKAVEVNNLRLYNCSYTPMNNIKAFSELAFLLLAGTGVGLSVQKHHVKDLPVVLGAQEPIGKQHKKRFLVSDDIEGWADAIKVLVESHFFGERQIAFDFRAIREKGAYLKTSGGRAPGPAPLEACLVKIDSIFCNAVITRGRGTKLKPIEVYDICCFIADMVLAGGIRRAALLSLFSLDDTEMLESKYGTWWESNPQRGRSNNSALVLRSQITREVFDSLWKKIEASGAGEPGIVFSDSADYGVNPCLTGDTCVMLGDGSGKTITLKEMSEIDTPIPVYSLDNEGNIVINNMFGTQVTRKDADICKVTLDNGDVIKATLDHMFRLSTGEWREAQDLSIGDSLWSASVTENQASGKYAYYRHIFSNRNTYQEHRLVAQYMLNNGKNLEDAVVHHIDHNSLNNSPDNLAIMTHLDHSLLHAQDRTGENNPIHAILADPDRREEFTQKLSAASHGLNNSNSHGMTNDELRRKAVEYVKSIGKIPSVEEWHAYSHDNSIPLLTSKYRISNLGTPHVLLRWAAIQAGVFEDEKIKNLHYHTLHNYLSWLEKGYDVRITDTDELEFLRHCEITNKDFWSSNPYAMFDMSVVTRAEINKYTHSDPEYRLRLSNTLSKAYEEKKEKIRFKQATIFNDLKVELLRKPNKKEWVAQCKLDEVSFEISRETSPFRSFDALKEYASNINHRVVSVEYAGKEDVYDGIVENTHNFFVTGNPNLIETTSSGNTRHTFINLSNCCEISLPANNLCNLTEINSSNLVSQEDFNYRARMASRIGTLQASYTDFHYLREEWRDTVEKEALIGVSLTGIASGVVTSLDMSQGAKEVVAENIRTAKAIGINPAARTTCVKPSGTASLLLGTSSGIHAWYAPYYWRRISVGKEEPIYTYLSNNHPELIEDDYFKPSTMAKIKIPMKAPDNAALRYETALDTLTRLKKVQTTWIANGHIEGINKNNVSCTISVRDSEWKEVGDWMWENRSIYTGIAVLPYDGGSYTQSPFEECTKEDYEEAMQYLTAIDLTAVFESVDGTSLQSEAACGGGACEIK